MEQKTFEYPKLGTIHTILVNNQVLLNGKEAAKILEFSNVAQALVDYCTTIAEYHISNENGVYERTQFISEGDVYRLCQQSKSPKRWLFKCWIEREVVPFVMKYQQAGKFQRLDIPYMDGKVIALRDATGQIWILLVPMLKVLGFSSSGGSSEIDRIVSSLRSLRKSKKSEVYFLKVEPGVINQNSYNAVRLDTFPLLLEKLKTLSYTRKAGLERFAKIEQCQEELPGIVKAAFQDNMPKVKQENESVFVQSEPKNPVPNDASDTIKSSKSSKKTVRKSGLSSPGQRVKRNNLDSKLQAAQLLFSLIDDNSASPEKIQSTIKMLEAALLPEKQEDSMFTGDYLF